MTCKIYKILAITLLFTHTTKAQDFDVCVGEPFYLYEFGDESTGSTSTFDITGGSAEFELPNGHNFNGINDSTLIIITTPGTLQYTRIVIVNEDGKSTIGTYNQMVVAVGCDIETDTAVIDTAIVQPEKYETFWMPNVFSPNGDSINDYIYPMSETEMLIPEMIIFDRWGAEVWSRQQFNTNDEAAGWDGGSNPAGVYVWIVKIQGKMMEFGDITLMR
jgi:gliding motility-associated-like protein